jgi:Secretion system C-terminal sorting domain
MFIRAVVIVLIVASMPALHAQTPLAIGGSGNGLVFKNPSLKTGTDLKKGATYLFKTVTTGVDAIVSIDDLVNGASVKKIDDNSGGLGFIDAFQPEVQIGGKGESYALFTVKFINATTGDPETLKSVQGTSIDIDGNGTLKEFADINMNGGTATYMGGTLEILLNSLPIINTLFNEFRADNILGIEHDNIDTSGKGVMYTVSNSNISSFSVKYGAKSTSTSNSSRQYSLYMKGFQYPNQVILPLDLLSFNAYLDKSNVNLNWSTASEKNVSHFAIEKSYDGKNFTDAATVFAFGNTTQTEVKNYSYTDNIKNTNSSIIYYRLRCIDLDGKYTYTQIRIVRAAQQSSNAQVLAYPNPFINELRVTLPQNWQSKESKIELFTANGQLVKAKNIASASQTETITTTDLGRGFYVIRVSSATETVQYKVIKN